MTTTLDDRRPEAQATAQPLALTDDQMTAIMAAAEPLPPGNRSLFLADVARALAGRDEIGDGTVGRIVREVQRRFLAPTVTPPGIGSKWR
jgi:hypothetical protein